MKKLHPKNILSSLAIILIVFSFSCSRSVVYKQRPITDITGLQKKTAKSCHLLSSSNYRLKFHTNVEFEGKNHALNGRIFLLSDTCIFISVISPSIGIEVGRLIANADSVCVFNKIDKTYYSSDYSNFYNLHGLNFNYLYSLFSGTYTGCDSLFLNSTNTSYFPEMGYFVVSRAYNENQSKSFSTTFFDSFGNLMRTEYKSASSDFLRVNYSNFAPKDGFPGKMNVTLGVKGNKNEMEIIINERTPLKKEKFPNTKTDIGKYKRIYL